MTRLTAGLRLATPVVVLLCALPVPGAAQDESADSAFHFEFGWSPGMRATVTSEQHSVRGGSPDVASELRVRTRYTMEIGEHPDGLAVYSQPGEVVDIEVGEADSMLVTFFEALSAVPMTQVVSGDGELLRVEGADGAIAVFRDVLGPLLDSAGAMPELQGLMQSFEGMLTEQAMTASAQELWNAMVWNWAWETYAPGEVWEFDTEQASPLVPGLLIPLRVRMGFAERVPCRPDADDRCVRVRIESEPDATEAMGMLNQFMARVTAATGETVSFTRFDQQNEITVVLDPATLQPYRFTTLKVIDAVMLVDGEESGMSRRDSNTTTFAWR